MELHNRDQAMSISAMEFIRSHYQQHRNQKQFALVARCAYHLRSQSDISGARAEVIAAKALGEYERGLHDSYIDMDVSTSQTIFLKAGGESFAFTAATLMKLMRIHAIPIS